MSRDSFVSRFLESWKNESQLNIEIELHPSSSFLSPHKEDGVHFLLTCCR